MESVDPEKRHFVASGLMAVFKKIFGPDVWSARMEYILGNTILALLEYPGSTLLSINPMLATKEFRKKVVASVTDPVVSAFWTQEFAKYTERFAAEATPAIQNKVGQFTSNALIRNIVGQEKSTIDMRRIMDEKKIFIVNLAKGRVGEDTARLLGAMIVTKLYLAAMSRVDTIDESKRSDFFLYVDEFQNFATESFANILSEARKYRLSLVLAHQYMAQLAEEVRDAVIGNVGTMLSFRVGAEDAEFLEKEFGPDFMATDIVNLGFAQVYLKLMIDGIASRPFSASTLPPIKSESPSTFREQIIEASRKNYGKPRAEVEVQIAATLLNIDADSAKKLGMAGGAPADGDGAGAFAQSAAPRPQVTMYDATCVVCNKKIQVPFLPDPKRPVFCKEHIGMAGQYKVQAPGSPPRPADGGYVERRPVYPTDRPAEQMREVKPVSLKELEQRPRVADDHSQRNFHAPRPPFQKMDQPFKKNDNLQALREALKKSLVQQENSSEKKEEKNNPPSSERTTPYSNGGKVEDNKSGTLRPGEKIEL